MILCILNNKAQTKTYGAMPTNYLSETVEMTEENTIKFNLIGTDSNKITCSLKLSDITIIVGTTELSQSELGDIKLGTINYPQTNKATCLLTLEGVPGEGQLKIKIAANTLTDSAGNKNSETTLATEVTMVSAGIRIPSNAAIGDYVPYDVSYTDTYMGYNYSSSDGWRLLKKTDNGDGTYDINIISTGVPARLNYTYNSNTGNNNNGWWGTDAQVKELYGSTYSSAGYDYDSGGYPNYYAAAGMYKNFENIKFSYGTSASANYGCYTKINGITGEDLYGSVFKVSGASSVRFINLADINTARGYSATDTTSTETTEPATGLFDLQHLVNLNEELVYPNEFNIICWLGNPGTSNRWRVYIIDRNGELIEPYYGSYTLNVRPVVTITRVPRVLSIL